MKSPALLGFLLLISASSFAGDAPPVLKCDLDGDGKAESIGVRKVGETEDQGDFYQLVVRKADNSVLWEGPRGMDPDAPLAFGSWHGGVSLPEFVGDIEGDGVVELIAEAPRSDVSPAFWRVFRWKNGAFVPAFTSALLPAGAQLTAFRWSEKAENARVWVNRFSSKAKDGWLGNNWG